MLISLFTVSTARTLASLEALSVSNCDGLKEIIQNASDLQSHDSVFPKLKDLYIGNCNSLECIFPVPFNQYQNNIHVGLCNPITNNSEGGSDIRHWNYTSTKVSLFPYLSRYLYQLYVLVVNPYTFT